MLLAPVVSPYAYDYDTPIMAVGAALLAGPVLERAHGWQLAVLLPLCWAVSGSGMAVQILYDSSGRVGAATGGTPTSPAGIAYLALAGLTLWILRGEFARTGAGEERRAGVWRPRKDLNPQPRT